MDENLLNIFSSYYKRIMRIESKLKSTLIDKYTALYKNNVYKITYNTFFSKTEKNRHQKDQIYTKLLKSKEAEQEKFALAISKMYLGEVIDFLGHPVFLKSVVRKNFFSQQISTKTTDFQSKAKLLNAFRNCVAHIDERKLKKDIKRFLSAVSYFELILGLNNIVTINSLNKINPNHKLSTSDILKIIYNENPDLFNDDKALIPVFDEIATLNGYSYDALPQRWTIIRQKFKLEKDLKIANLENFNDSQMKLDL